MRRSWNREACGRKIGMCGYTSVPEDGRTCILFLIYFNFICFVALNVFLRLTFQTCFVARVYIHRHSRRNSLWCDICAMAYLEWWLSELLGDCKYSIYSTCFVPANKCDIIWLYMYAITQSSCSSVALLPASPLCCCCCCCSRKLPSSEAGSPHHLTSRRCVAEYEYVMVQGTLAFLTECDGAGTIFNVWQLAEASHDALWWNF